ncbi:MAG: flagellar hook-basal body complex protein FliE [Methanomicrobiales archaeon]|jgi:dephospho-CoA kinase|nr:flagellar hook-basal body complex protein FliE [Methanomicrobiales archaeon]
MKVIAVVGMPGSGKGEFSAIAQDMGIPVVVMGDVIREEVKKQGLPPTDESMGIVARALREKHGMAAIAHVCVPVIMRQEADLVLVDGVRGDAEVILFSESFPEFSLVSIEAPLRTRFARLSERGRSDDLMDISELVARDERECSFGLGRAIELASVRIENNGTREAFQEKARELLARMRAA